ncbi:uncharacterized protein Dvir_GJ10094 [Drosophila virilis]|uniref:HEAT repeat-containing protein 5A n=1 Tax=Drosophila virilis TaxID=7244 RepID=B4M569_DROVI|nr:uncharacterized protein Dvir_GJ10094 [Drosophila virilis]
MENLNFARTPQFLRKVINEARRSFIHSDDTAAAGKPTEDSTSARDEMELAHSLTLNEEAVKQLPEHKRAVFELEWLRYLEKSLPHMPKHEIKTGQKKLVQQLLERIQGAPGPPMRKLIASALATLFSVGDTFMLFDTVNACNDILKNKDDSPSYLPTKLAAICVLGSMYEKLGRMMGRTYEETVQILIRTLRNAESQARIEIMHTLEKVSAGMGTAIANVHKDIYKAAKHCLLDRVMAVRVAAARCILKMIYSASFLYQTELENLGTLCFRAFDGSNYEVRCAVAQLLGTLLAYTQQLAELAASNKKSAQAQAAAAALQAAKGGALRLVSLDEALGILMSGFLRGGASFLKGTGEIIKGSSGVNREVRVGVTHAYVVFVQFMGSVWLERQLGTFLAHVLDLVANPKAACSHVDAVYSRKCINFILRSTIGKMLGEKAQSAACKELIHLVAKQMNSIDFNPENAKDSNQETLFSQHLLVCALQELSSLFIGLGTTAQNLLTDQSLNAIDATCAVLVHPCAAARLAASWCLRSCCIAVPSQITPLIDRFIDAIEQMRSSPEAVAGYSCALAAILGSARYSPLGIPHTKGKVVFNCAEELLRSASQNSRMSLHRTQAGWLLIGAIMTLGSPVVKGLLPRMLLLWRNSFPRSNKELESEKARGDAFTWQVTLEGRAGALSVMHSFLLNCPDLVSEDITRRLLTPIESALAMLVNLATVLKSYGTQLKAPAAMVRLRLFETLTLLPPTALEASYTHLLRMLVSEFTLSDNAANTTNSLLRTLCHGDDSIILGTWLQETNHRTIEDQMEPNRKVDGEHLQPNSAAGSGALEHDPCCLYRPNWSAQYGSNASSNASTSSNNNNIQLINKAQQCPGPLPLGVAVIDMSVTLYGTIFPKVANKHRLQMLDHFAECIKQAKSNRQEAIQMNIFTALLYALKHLTDSKTTIGQEDVKKSATSLIVASLTSTNSTIRCAAGEALGRLAQVVADSHFTAELAQNSFDKLKSARDVVTRTGHSHALGCLHRYVGGMSSSQHLNTSVSILLALGQDSASPGVQGLVLHALGQNGEIRGSLVPGHREARFTPFRKRVCDEYRYRAEETPSTHPAVQPRWPTRVFAAQCVRRIIASCEAANALHFDLLQAKEQQLIKSRSGDYLILHLAELIRMSFMAATSDSDQLRLEGLRTLQEIIDRFANVPEPEFPGHLLLEQYQAQVGAALRPAFAPDTPSHVTAAACEVCSAWIGSGVARDISDLRRVHQLLVSSLNKLYTKTNCSTQLYNESMATLEKLSILKAWAEVYIVAMLGNGKAPASLLTITPAGAATELVTGLELDTDNRGESLLGLVQPELHNLSNHWLAAMKDHALLLLPVEFQSQLPRDGGSFYTTDTINSSKPHYMTSWPPILYAAALWLRDEGFAKHVDTQSQVEPCSTQPESAPESNNNNNHITHGSLSADRFHMIFGICMEALCSMRSSDKPRNIVSCLRALHSIFDSDWARRQLIKDRALTIELCHVLHRQILTRDELLVQLLCVEILKQTIQAAREDLERRRDTQQQQQSADNANENQNEGEKQELDLGEGSVMQPGSSHVYAVLEVCLCLFVRQIPSLNPSKQSSLQLDYAYARNAASFFSVLGDDNGRLVASGLQCVEQLLELCTPSGALTILPTILYMTTSIMREITNKSAIDSSILANTCAVQAALKCLRSVCVHRWAHQAATQEDWQQLLQSALATIIDMTKTAGDNEERKVDEVTMLLAIAVFILHTPASVVATPSLQYPCINHFRQCLQSEHLSVKLKCIETTRSIFTQADLKTATPYIHALAPRIIESLYADSSKTPASELELQVTLESIVTVEQLIELAEPQHRNLLQDIQMLTLLVPVLIGYLAEPSKLRTLPKYQRQLHEQSLNWLLKIGPKYPQEFKALMCQKPELRQKLEAAIRNQQQSINLAQKASEAQRSGLLAKPQKPTIKLKTDFSNFQ